MEKTDKGVQATGKIKSVSMVTAASEDIVTRVVLEFDGQDAEVINELAIMKKGGGMISIAFVMLQPDLSIIVKKGRGH